MDAQPANVAPVEHRRPASPVRTALMAVVAVCAVVVAATHVSESNARMSYERWQREFLTIKLGGRVGGEEPSATAERLKKEAVENGPKWASYGMLADGNK